MSTIGTNRASYIRVSNIRLGQSNRPQRIAGPSQLAKINKAIDCLNAAKASTIDSTYRYQVSEAYRTIRNLAAEPSI